MAMTADIVKISIVLLVSAILLPMAVQNIQSTPSAAYENTAQITDETIPYTENYPEFDLNVAENYIESIDNVLYSDGTTNDNLVDSYIVDADEGIVHLEFVENHQPGSTSEDMINYTYATDVSEWNGAIPVLFKTLLPVLAVLGVVMILVGKYMD